MNEQIREQLIGYVLGALSEEEQRAVEERLSSEPQWRDELTVVQRMLEPLADGYTQHDPPPGLVERTCQFVRQESERLQVQRPARRALGEGTASSPYSSPRWGLTGIGDGSGRWGLADWVVLSGICLSALALLFPALLSSRLSARLVACQNNLRELGIALSHFSELSPERWFPHVPLDTKESFAGVCAVQLQGAGLLNDPRTVICPEAAPLYPVSNFRIPAAEEIDAAEGEQLIFLQRVAGGTYAYPLGFFSEGEHHPPRNLARPYFVLMADAPLLELGRFAIHGAGSNVLFEDCHVQLLRNWDNGESPIDNPFCNRYRRLEAGADVNDAVVAPSYYPPVLRNADYRY